MNETRGYHAKQRRIAPDYPFRKKAALFVGGALTGVAGVLGLQELRKPDISPVPIVEPTVTSTPLETMVVLTSDQATPTATATVSPTETPNPNTKQNWEIFGLPSYHGVGCDQPLDASQPHYSMRRVLEPLNTRPGHEGNVPDAKYTTQVVFEPVHPGGEDADTPQECYMSFDYPIDIEVTFPGNFVKMGIVLVRAISPGGEKVEYQLDEDGIMPAEDGTMPAVASAWVSPDAATVKLFKTYGVMIFVPVSGGGPITVTPMNN